MALDLATLVAPAHTAVLTMEMQRGIIGDLARLTQLRDETEAAGTVINAARLLDAGRAAGATIVHCTAAFRPDRRGSNSNAPMFQFAAREPDHLVIGTPAAEVMPALGPEDGDLVIDRVHGMTPFTGTSLDFEMRNLGITTVVVTGVSVNIGVIGLVLEAVNLGYQVVVATDAVAGVPAEYAQAVLDNSIRMLATLRSVDQIINAWNGQETTR
jgi:nicotinamidase-related amidase